MEKIICTEINDVYKKEYIFTIQYTTHIVLQEFFMFKKNIRGNYLPFSYYSHNNKPLAGTQLSKDMVVIPDLIKQQAIKKAHEMSLSKFVVVQ